MSKKEKVYTVIDQKDSDTSSESLVNYNDLLKFFGVWEGDDFEECLQKVYSSRGKIE